MLHSELSSVLDIWRCRTYPIILGGKKQKGGKEHLVDKIFFPVRKIFTLFYYVYIYIHIYTLFLFRLTDFSKASSDCLLIHSSQSAARHPGSFLLLPLDPPIILKQPVYSTSLSIITSSLDKISHTRHFWPNTPPRARSDWLRPVSVFHFQHLQRKQV